MQYEWYIDVFFLLNLGMDTMLLLVLGRLMKLAVPRWRLAAGGAVGAAGSCLAVFLWQFPGPAAWLAGGLMPAVAMLRITFHPKSVRGYIKLLLLLFLETFCVGGIMEALYEHTRAGYYFAWILQGNLWEGMPLFIWCLLAAGGCLGFQGLWLLCMEIRQERQMYCQVSLRLGDRKLKAAGYLDTGNCLYEPEHGNPVHIVSEKIWESLYRPGVAKIRIPYHTVGNPMGSMAGMQLDVMEIKSGGKKPLVLIKPWIAKAPYPINHDGSYEILLHKEICHQTGQKGGVTDGD